MSYNTITQTFDGIAVAHRQCWCGISFAIPKALADYYVRANEAKPESYTLYCPLGHGMVPTAGRGEADRLRDELAREKHRTEQARADADNARRTTAIRDRQLSARKGQITKIRKRIGNGVCPCCNRTFSALGRHMATQHPDWRPEHDGPVPPVRGDAVEWKALRARRITLGVSESDAATAVGITASSLRKYEHGTLPSLTAAVRLFDFLATQGPAE